MRRKNVHPQWAQVLNKERARLAAMGWIQSGQSRGCSISPRRLCKEVLKVNESERYLSRPKAAKYLGVSVRLFDEWVSDGQFPVVRAGRRVLADRADLDAFYASRKSTSDSGPK